MDPAVLSDNTIIRVNSISSRYCGYSAMIELCYYSIFQKVSVFASIPPLVLAKLGQRGGEGRQDFLKMMTE